MVVMPERMKEVSVGTGAEAMAGRGVAMAGAEKGPRGVAGVSFWFALLACAVGMGTEGFCRAIWGGGAEKERWGGAGRDRLRLGGN